MYLGLRSFLLYIGDSKLLAVYMHLMGFYALIRNRLVIDLGPLITLLTFLGGFKEIACSTRGFKVLYSWIVNAVVYVVIVVL